MDLDLERRILGLSGSAVLIVIGNALPKFLTPLSMLPPGGAVRQSAARRFLGLPWVLLGSAMAVLFLIMPLQFAVMLRSWLVGACVFTWAAAIVWMNAGPESRNG